MRRGFGIAQGYGDEFMRQLGLVDDAERILADRPDRAVMFAVDFHYAGAVAFIAGYSQNFAYQADNLGRELFQSRSGRRKSI